MALTQISTDGIKDGTITGSDLATNVDLVDNQKLRLGTGNDLQIYHDGSNSRIHDGGTGVLAISGSEVHIQNAAQSENCAKFIQNGAVELYHNNVKKFETTANGADFTVASSGQVNIFGSGGTNGLRISGPQSASSACLFFNTNHQNVSGGTDQYTIQCGGANHKLLFKHGDTTGNVVFELDDTEHVRIPQDSKALKIGAGQDLQIYHDGTTNYIRTENGSINITKSNTENIAKFIPDGAVELYHDNSKKFETLNTGIQVTGNVTPTGYMKLVDNMQIYFGTGNDLEILSDGTNGIIKNHVGGSITIRANQDIQLKTNASDGGADDAVKCVNNGAVELYYDNTKVFETTSTGAKTSLANPVLEIEGTGTSGDAALFLDANANHWLVRADNSTSAGTFSIKSGTPSSSTHRLLINSSGNVGINETSPVNLLTISTSGAQSDTVGMLQVRYTGTANANSGLTVKNYNGTSQLMQWETYGVRIGNRIITNSGEGNVFITAGNDSVRKQINADGHTNHFYTTAANPKEVYHWSNNRTGMSFRSANTERGNIFFFDSGVQFNTGSDYRLKENVTLISDGITRIKQLIPRKFNWIIDESNTPVDGFLAHEVSSIVPEAVNGTKDAVATQEDVDSGRSQKIGDPIHQMIDHSKLVPLLAAGLKEAISKIEILETEVAALKAS